MFLNIVFEDRYGLLILKKFYVQTNKYLIQYPTRTYSYINVIGTNKDTIKCLGNKMRHFSVLFTIHQSEE